MSKSTWIKETVDWDEEDWLDALDWPVRACWHVLMRTCKATGWRGRCPAPKLAILARTKRIPAEYLQEIVRAAVAAGELVEEGNEWVFTKWAETQESDSAERVRRKRERDAASRDVTSVTLQDQADETVIEAEIVTECNVTAVTDHGFEVEWGYVTDETRNDCNACNVTQSTVIQPISVTPVTLPSLTRERFMIHDSYESAKSVSEDSLRSSSAAQSKDPPKKGRSTPQSERDKPNHQWLMAERVCWQLCQGMLARGLEWPEPSNALILREMKLGGPLDDLVGSFGEDGALDLWFLAVDNWSGLPTGWAQIRSQLGQLRNLHKRAPGRQGRSTLDLVLGGSRF